MVREYFKFISAVHLFLVREGEILLLRRFNTGYEDGNYSVPAGHIDGRERVTVAMIREAKEETGIDIDPTQLRLVHVMHRISPGESDERIDFFFEVRVWRGEPIITEPNKCDDLYWFSLTQLPENIIPYVRTAIQNYQDKKPYSEFGWHE